MQSERSMAHMEIGDAQDGSPRQTKLSRKSLVLGFGIFVIGAVVVATVNGNDASGAAKMMMIGAENDATCGTKNVALRKPAFQISNYNSIYLAPTAVDGNTNQNLIRGRSCSATAGSLNPWLAVDLGTSSQVCSVRIYNRGDCCANRLTNFEVFVSNRKPIVGKQFNIQASEVCASYNGGAFSVKTLACTRSVKGRYVGVEINGRQFLSICELQVFGKKAPPPPPCVVQCGALPARPRIKYSMYIGKFGIRSWTSDSLWQNVWAGIHGAQVFSFGLKFDPPVDGADLQYDIHVAHKGWLPPYQSGTMPPILGVIYAFRVRVIGPNRKCYNVHFKGHFTNYGDCTCNHIMCSNGQECSKPFHRADNWLQMISVVVTKKMCP